MVEKWFLENCYVMAIPLQMKIGGYWNHHVRLSCYLYIFKHDFVQACCNYSLGGFFWNFEYLLFTIWRCTLVFYDNQIIFLPSQKCCWWHGNAFLFSSFSEPLIQFLPNLSKSFLHKEIQFDSFVIKWRTTSLMKNSENTLTTFKILLQTNFN